MIDKTFPIPELARFEVRIQSGEVQVLSGSPNEVRVIADARPQAELEVVQRGPTVIVTTRRRGWLGQDDAHVTVYAPDGADGMVNTASADVAVSAPLARLTVNTASGDVRFDRVADLEVKTASGDIRGNLVTGSASVATASGDVRIDTCQGDCRFSSASGDVRVGACEGSFSANTASGDCTVGRCHADEVNFKSMSGSVRLGVPARTRVQLDASTLSGKVSIPEPAQRGEPPERTMIVKARLVSGNLTLDRTD